MNHEVLKTVGWNFAMAPEEAENVLKVCGWSFEARDTTNMATKRVVKTRWYARHEDDPKSFRHAMLGFEDKSRAIKMAWQEQFGKHIVLS